jgi:hypothetical protein
MTRLALAAVPFFALAGLGFAQAAPPATPAAPMHHARAMHRASPNTAEARRETHALNLIETKGYGGFTDFRADGKNFTASVMSAGKHYTVTVNPDTGQVTRQS